MTTSEINKKWADMSDNEKMEVTPSIQNALFKSKKLSNWAFVHEDEDDEDSPVLGGSFENNEIGKVTFFRRVNSFSKIENV